MISTSKNFLALGAIATLLQFGPTLAATPLTLNADDLSQMPPTMRMNILKQKAQEQSVQRHTSTLTTDTTAPVLNSFHTGAATVNAAHADAQAKVTVDLSDDMSGIVDVYVRATSPSGTQTIFGYDKNMNFLTKSYHRVVNVDMRAFSEPGVWTITQIGAVDAAGNSMVMDGPELAALGSSTTFTVTNVNGGDIVPPTLVSGSIVKTSISLSTPPVGATSGKPLLGVKILAQDTANGGFPVSGATQVWTAFCLSDMSNCIYPGAVETDAGLSQTSFNVSFRVYTIPVGKYYLYSVEMQDSAGNDSYMLSTKFGGTTDFTTLFPATVITIKP